MSNKSCAFTGHRPKHFPWKYTVRYARKQHKSIIIIHPITRSVSLENFPPIQKRPPDSISPCCQARWTRRAGIRSGLENTNKLVGIASPAVLCYPYLKNGRDDRHGFTVRTLPCRALCSYPQRADAPGECFLRPSGLGLRQVPQGEDHPAH